MIDNPSIKTILIDDEHHSLSTLQYELNQHCPKIDIIAACQSGKEGLEVIRKKPPDLLFLDIEMPGMNGFQVLKEIGEIDFEVIFVTAYDQYAIQAFRFAAVDYLLKPIITEQLIEAVDRVYNKREKKLSNQLLKNLLHNIQADKNHPPRIALPQGNGLDFVSVHEIIRCQAESNYTHVYLQNGQRYFLSKTLREMESLLDDYHFYRSHQSHLVNLDQIKRYIKRDGGYLIMTDGNQIPISRRRAEKFHKLMKK